MPDDPVHRRDELMRPYRRPGRRSAATVWRRTPALRATSVVAAACIVAGVAGALAGVTVLLLTAAVGVMLAVYVLAVWGMQVGREAWRLRRAWSQGSELRDVLAGRPQAGTEDPELAHALFAVSVEDDGRLLTWCYRPLAIDAGPAVDEVEVPGRPRYGARTVEDRAFDVEQAAVAAGQLVEAQGRAAEREAKAAVAARRAAEAGVLSADLMAEARSTAAALQRTTGQRSRRD